MTITPEGARERLEKRTEQPTFPRAGAPWCEVAQADLREALAAWDAAKQLAADRLLLVGEWVDRANAAEKRAGEAEATIEKQGRVIAALRDHDNVELANRADLATRRADEAIAALKRTKTVLNQVALARTAIGPIATQAQTAAHEIADTLSRLEGEIGQALPPSNTGDEP